MSGRMAKGPRGQEMLHRLAVMRTRVRHGGDDADLRIGPADAFDAGTLPEPRALAVGGDEERRLDALAAAERGRDPEGVGRDNR